VGSFLHAHTLPLASFLNRTTPRSARMLMLLFILWRVYDMWRCLTVASRRCLMRGCERRALPVSPSSLINLGTAVNRAAAMGANEISNSYGGSDSSYDSTYFNHPGIAITVSSGDNGYGVQYPAASQYVTAVGGTTLNRASNARGWSETAWSGAGSGCSAYFIVGTRLWLWGSFTI